MAGQAILYMQVKHGAQEVSLTFTAYNAIVKLGLESESQDDFTKALAALL